MNFESVTLTHFRCFGPKPHRIGFDPALTALIGANGSGKTALMYALLRLFGITSEQRRVRRQDFHIPLNEGEDRPKKRALSIDAVFRFPELDDEEEDDVAQAVPVFFEKMGADDGGILKFRLRLEATWTDDGTEDGTIEERLFAVQTLDEKFNPETDCQTITPYDRARIQVVYIPANRDPGSHVTSFLRGRLWRAISWSKGFRKSHKESGERLNNEFATQTAVKRIEEALTARWQALHTGGVDATYPPDRHHLARMTRWMRQHPGDARRAT
jgi:hypothetical protein